MTWTITFYSAKVEKETLALPAGILASFLRITELIDAKASADPCFAR